MLGCFLRDIRRTNVFLDVLELLRRTGRGRASPLPPNARRKMFLDLEKRRSGMVGEVFLEDGVLLVWLSKLCTKR